MAAHKPLRPDATLRSVLPLLEDQLAFVRQAFAVINAHNRKHGAVVLRLGVSPSSKGKRPNYCIDDLITGETVAVIDGNNHKDWPRDKMQKDGDWSCACMTFDEVKDLLFELRSHERTGR